MKLFIMHLSPISYDFSLFQSYSAAYFQTPSVYVPPIMPDAKFHSHMKPQAELYTLYPNFYGFRQQTGRQEVLRQMVVSIMQIKSPTNFLVNPISICYCHSHLLDLCHTYKEFVCCLYVMILPCILVMRQQHILTFGCVYF
jgi:hypothetical protein